MPLEVLLPVAALVVRLLLLLHSRCAATTLLVGTLRLLAPVAVQASLSAGELLLLVLVLVLVGSGVVGRTPSALPSIATSGRARQAGGLLVSVSEAGLAVAVAGEMAIGRRTRIVTASALKPTATSRRSPLS